MGEVVKAKSRWSEGSERLRLRLFSGLLELLDNEATDISETIVEASNLQFTRPLTRERGEERGRLVGC